MLQKVADIWRSFTKISRQRKRRPTANLHQWVASYMSSAKGEISKETKDSSLSQNHLYWKWIIEKKRPRNRIFRPILMSPYCRHLHNHILRAYNWSNVLLFHTKLIVWNHFLRSCGINAFACDLDCFWKQKETRFLWSILELKQSWEKELLFFW